MENKYNANTDTTYCTSETCKDKCWRHISNRKFDENEGYWLQEYCADERDRLIASLKVEEAE